MTTAHRSRQAIRSRLSNARQNGECWEWQGQLRYGYGKTHVSGVQYSAHRWFYERFVGPIPEGLQIDHLCRNRKCVAPWHLEAVTALENSRRKHAARQFGADKEFCTRGHRMTAENTYIYQPEGEPPRRHCRDCIKHRHALLSVALGRQPHSRDKTHCKRGHEFTAANTYRYKNRRVCRTCARAATQQFKQDKEKS